MKRSRQSLRSSGVSSPFSTFILRFLPCIRTSKLRSMYGSWAVVTFRQLSHVTVLDSFPQNVWCTTHLQSSESSADPPFARCSVLSINCMYSCASCCWYPARASPASQLPMSMPTAPNPSVFSAEWNSTNISSSAQLTHDSFSHSVCLCPSER